MRFLVCFNGAATVRSRIVRSTVEPDWSPSRRFNGAATVRSRIADWSSRPFDGSLVLQWGRDRQVADRDAVQDTVRG